MSMERDGNYLGLYLVIKKSWKYYLLMHIRHERGRVDSKSPQMSGKASWKLVILEYPTKG